MAADQHIVLRFLKWFCPSSLYEGIEGDLLEQFEEELKLKGARIAKRNLFLNTIKFFKPDIFLRNRFSFQLINAMLLNSYLKITYRNILRNKGYSFINIFGLSLGIAVCLLTFNFVQYERSYDAGHPDIDRMYRINQTNIWDPAGGVFGSVGPAVASALKSDFPEMEEILRINTPGAYIVRYTAPDGNVLAFNEDNVLAADSNFFSFFNFKLKEGSSRALYGKDKVVLSDKAAKRLFGDESALGKIIQLGDDKISVEVTGVTEVQPENIHFHFDYLISMYTNPNIKQFEWSWVWTQTVTYVKLRKDADPVAVDNKLKSFADRHAPATFKRIGMNYEEFMREKGGWFLYIQPVKDIYLYSDSIGNRIGPVGDIKYVYILSAVAIFILLIAVVNFINLSTARGATRAKEVGVKKTLGLRRGSLIAQFQVENITITVISVLLGLVLVEAFRSVIQPVVGIRIPSGWSSPVFIGVLIAFPFVVGFLAGLYPSFYLTAFSPIQVLKGKLVNGLRSSGLRNALVVFQFTISIALMAATLIVFQQLNFFRSQSVGFDKDNLLIINYADKLGPQLESFRNEISGFSGVKDATVSMDIRNGYEDIFMREGDDKKVSISQYKIDDHFLTTTKMELLSGRAYDDRLSDNNAVIVNETTARQFGWTNEEAIGKKVIYVGDEVGPQEVIGVVKDFHFQSLHQNIRPMMFMNVKSTMWGDERIVSIRYEGTPYELLTKLESKWKQLASEATPFSYSFYNEQLKAQYQQEERLGTLFFIFTGLSIAIAVIGLIGLVSYSAEVRKKEIGIRKVFGASTPRLVIMMNSQYVRLIAVSLLLASPLSWWALQQWLDTFAYRVEINPAVFVAAGVTELVLAMLCVGYLSLRAASLNPSQVLKEE
jgi:putative ABC transport system permease protein